MRNLFLSVFVLFMITSCTQNKLDKQKALQLIVASKQYPKTIDFKINTADPNLVSQLINSDLEKAHLVTVEEPHSLGDMGSTVISFSSKANPYLLPTTTDEKGFGIQRVKMAEEGNPQVTGVAMARDGKSAIAEFKTTYKNITPFSVLAISDLRKPNQHQARFEFKDGEWKLTGIAEKNH